MDPITALIASSKIKVGLWGKDFFTFLTTNFEWFFDAIANGLTYVLQGLINRFCRKASWPSRFPCRSPIYFSFQKLRR